MATTTPLQKKVDAIQAKVDDNNLSRVSTVAPPVVAPETPVVSEVKAPTTIESIRAARAKVNAPVNGTVAPVNGTVAPVNTAPLTTRQEEAKARLEARPVPVDTTKIGTGVGENFVPYKPVDQTVIPDTTGKTNPDGTPATTEVKTETTTTPTTTEKKIETTTPIPVVVQNEDEAFKTLMAGGNLADTRENNAFKQTYKQFGFYNGLDNKTLGNKIAGGEVGSKFMNLLARFNPTKYAEVVKLSEDATKVNDINTNAQRLYNTANEVAQPAPVKASEQLLQDLVSGIENVPQKYSDIVAEAYAANPEIKEKSDKIAVIDDKIDTLDTEIDKVYDTYRSQYPTLPKGILMSMVSSANKNLTNERNALVKESKLLYAQYKDEKDHVDQGIQYDIAQQDKLDSRKFELQKILYGDKKEEEIDLRELAQAEKVIKETRKYDEKKANEMELLNIQKAIANIGLTPVPGANYETLLKQFASGMEADKKYERKTAEAALSDKKRLTAADFKEIDIIDDITGEKIGTKIINIHTGKELSPSEYSVATGGGGSMSPDSVEAAIAECRTTGSCGQGVNQYIQKITGKYGTFGDGYDKDTGNGMKTDKINSYEPKVGAIAIWNPSVGTSGEQWGHVGVVLGDNGDGTVKVHDWNWDNKENQKTHNVLKSEILKNGGGYQILNGATKESSGTNGGISEQKRLYSDVTKRVNFSNISGKDEIRKDIANDIRNNNMPGLQRTLDANFEQGFLTGPNQTKWQEDKKIMEQVDELQEGLARFVQGGGKLNWLSGTKEEATQKITKSTKDPALAALGVSMADILDSFARGRTGAVINKEETIAFGRIMPTLGDTPDLINAKIDGFRNNINAKTEKYKQNTIREQIGEESYNTIYGEKKTTTQSKEENQSDIDVLLKTKSKEEVYDLLVAEGLNPSEYNLGSAQRGASGKY